MLGYYLQISQIVSFHILSNWSFPFYDKWTVQLKSIFKETKNKLLMKLICSKREQGMDTNYMIIFRLFCVLRIEHEQVSTTMTRLVCVRKETSLIRSGNMLSWGSAFFPQSLQMNDRGLLIPRNHLHFWLSRGNKMKSFNFQRNITLCMVLRSLSVWCEVSTLTSVKTN